MSEGWMGFTSMMMLLMFLVLTMITIGIIGAHWDNNFLYLPVTIGIATLCLICSWKAQKGADG